MKYKYEVQLASLLHDMGKFYQKAGQKKGVVGGIEFVDGTNSHPEISARFVEKHRDLFEKAGLDVNALKELVLRHHANNYGDKEKFILQDASEEYISYCNIIHIADGMSSSGDRSDKGTRSAYRPLASVFGTLGNKKINLKMSANRFLPYKCSSEEERQEIDKNEDRKKAAVEMLEAFAKDVNKLYSKECLTGAVLVEEFTNLLYKYTRFVNPATNTEYPDASLYDHSVTTCAIASCIHRNLVSKNGDTFTYKNVNDNPTDISVIEIKLAGLEEYITNNRSNRNVTALTAGRFRACEELVNDIAINITKACDLSSANILAKSNDMIYIMIAQSDLNKALGMLKSENSNLIKTGRGLSLDWAVVKSWVFADSFDNNFENSKRYTGVVEYLLNGSEWDTHKFVIEHKITDKTHRCIYCGCLTEGREVCDSCSKELQIGSEIYTENDYGIIYAVAPEFQEVLKNGFRNSEMYDSSVSRISTYLRMMREFFTNEIAIILNKYDDAEILFDSMDRIYIICNLRDIPYIVKDIAIRYDNYTSEVYKLKIVTSEFKQNTRNVHIINYVNNRMKTLLSKKSDITVTIGNVYGNSATLDKYIKILERVISLNKNDDKVTSSLMYKLIDCLEMYIEFAETKDASKLMCMPYLSHEIDKIDRNNSDKFREDKKKLVLNVLKVIEDSFGECKSAEAKIWIEALNKGCRVKKIA